MMKFEPTTTIDGPLTRWAGSKPLRAALTERDRSLSFSALEECVKGRASDIAARPAPRHMLAEGRCTAERLIQFLAILRTGRCAVVLDEEWSGSVRARVLAQLAAMEKPGRPRNDSLFYLGFTSGSTGMPKAFLRSHSSWIESFNACVQALGPDAAGAVLAPGSISHSLSLFGMLLGLWTGGGVVVQPRFSALQALASLESDQASCFIGVPSHLLAMLECARRKRFRPILGVRLVMISGARWMRHRTPELRRLFPCARIVEFYGTSETSFVSWIESDECTPAAVVGQPFPGVEIAIRPSDAAPGTGAIFVKSKMQFDGYAFDDRDPTEAHRDGHWLSVGDIGHVDAEGRLHLHGRHNRMLVTSGKNVFPEEVEALLEAMPGIAAASLHSRPDPLRGSSVVAVLNLCDADSQTFDSKLLHQHCRRELDGFKVPREFYVAPAWPRTQSGKTDHAALSRQLSALPEIPSDSSHTTTPLSCLRKLP